TGRQPSGTESWAASVSAIRWDCSATWRSVSSPYRDWLPVRNQTWTSSPDGWVGICSPRSVVSPLGGDPAQRWPRSAVGRDVLVGIVELSEVPDAWRAVRLRSTRQSGEPQGWCRRGPCPD